MAKGLLITRLIVLIIFCFISVKCEKENFSFNDDDEKIESIAVKNLIWRLLPGTADRFDVIVNRSFVTSDGKEKFQLQSLTSESDSTNLIKIYASSASSAANGFHYYIKYYLKLHVSWSGDQLNGATGDLPKVINKTVVLEDKLRYYFNVCTFRLVSFCPKFILN